MLGGISSEHDFIILFLQFFGSKVVDSCVFEEGGIPQSEEGACKLTECATRVTAMPCEMPRERKQHKGTSYMVGTVTVGS